MDECSTRKAERKILGALLLIDEAGYLTNRKGLAKIIRGKEDLDTYPLTFLRCFGYAPSLSTKTISRRIGILLKKGLVVLKDTPGLKEALILTEKGKAEADYRLLPSLSKKPEEKNIVRKSEE